MNNIAKLMGSFIVYSILIFQTNCVLADDPQLVDCPLRDTPYSIASPLMDVMLSKEASAIANTYMDGVIDKLPPTFASIHAPSFSAILNLKTIAAMGGITDEQVLQKLNEALLQLPLTEQDKRARCARYDVIQPDINMPAGSPKVLVFEKMTGFRDGPSVEAGSKAIKTLADKYNWGLAFSDKGAAMTADILQHFDVVIWNNVSGDVLTLKQRKAFEDFINQGGGYVGIHGSAGDPIYFWDWYVDTLIGARFIGHPMDPQFQDATINFEENHTDIAKGLGTSVIMNDEWYSFQKSPRQNGANVIATIDESTYSQKGRWGQNVSMGSDHPIVWSNCIGKGRSFYSAIGHRPEIYDDKTHMQMLSQAVMWASDKNACVAK